MPRRGAEVYVEVYGEKVVAEALESAAERALDFRPIWGSIFEKIEEIEKLQYETEGARGPSGKWYPLDQGYQWWKWKHHQSLDILKAHETMYQALTGTTQDSIRDAQDQYAVFGADLDQFRIQQDPPEDSDFVHRFPIDLTEQDRREIANMLMGYILDASAGGTWAGEGMFKTSPRTGKKYYAKRGPGGRFVKRSS